MIFFLLKYVDQNCKKEKDNLQFFFRNGKM